MGYPTPSEPDRFTPYQKATAPAKATNVTGADWQKMRACMSAAGLPENYGTRIARYVEQRGGTFAWSAAAPDALAVQLKNWGYALTRVGIHKDKASAFCRTFALLGNGLGGPAVTGFTVPATFKAPV